MTTITMPKNLSTDKLSFDKARVNSMGGKVVYMKYNGQNKMVVQTPKMNAPFGISSFTADPASAPKMSLDVSFKGMKEDPRVERFHNKMKELDEYLIDYAVSNSVEWFGTQKSRAVIEEFYIPIVKKSKDPIKYAPTMKFKIQSNIKNDEQIMDVEAYDHERNRFDLDNFSPSSKVEALIECSSVWFVAKQFGVSWKLVQVKVGKPEKIEGYGFLDNDDESDDENVENEENDEDVDVLDAEEDDNVVDASDDTD